MQRRGANAELSRFQPGLLFPLISSDHHEEVAMAITKIMGIETEYGVSSPGSADFNPVVTSSVLVNAFAGRARGVRWDYEQESPQRDARGYDAGPRDARGDGDDTGLANVILTNGGRYYVDHAHPEYSSPECVDPRSLVAYDKAGERILAASAQRAAELLPGSRDIHVYKNNTDGKGASYGSHENVLVDRATPFPQLVQHLVPFLVSRQVFAGAGALVRDSRTNAVQFQIAQRSQFFEVEVGLETTLKRPIVNTRDEPHADPERYRRLHVILGDANLNEVAIFLKVGTLALVLSMIEDGVAPGEHSKLANPVQALRSIARDPTLTSTVELRDGRKVRALDLQWSYLEAAKSYLKEHPTPAWHGEVVTRWEAALAGLDEDPLQQTRTVDWVAKYHLMRQYVERDGLHWEDPKLALIDLQYHDVDPRRGLYHRLVRSGRVERLIPEEEITACMTTPPPDTRAWFRGQCLARFPRQIAAAGWDAIVFDTGQDNLQRVPMLEPTRGTQAQTGALLDASADAAQLLERLRATPTPPRGAKTPGTPP